MGLIVVFALAGLGYVLYEQTAVKPDTVSLALGFTPNGGDAPIYYGLESGIYRQNGINLSIIPEASHVAGISALVAGDVDFAVVSPAAVVDYVAHNNSTDIVIVASKFAKSDLAVVFNNASISQVSDLNGKAGAMLSPALGDVSGDFHLFATTNGLNVSSMDLQYGSVTTSDDLLLSGKVQFIVVAIQNLPVVQATGAAEGLKLGAFVMADYGVASAGDSLATTRSMIQQHPDIVRAFVQATMQSMVSAYSNQEQAVSDLVRDNPQLNQTSNLQAYQILLRYCSIDPQGLTSPLQYGWMDPQYMQQTVDNEIVANNLGAAINATTLYTNQFVEPP